MPLSAIRRSSGLGAFSNATARSTFSATTSCRKLSVKSTIPSSLPSRIAWASLMSSSCRINFLTVGFIRMISTSGARVWPVAAA